MIAPKMASTQNPILWQEINHQQRSSPRLTRRYWLIGPLILIAMVGGVLASLQIIENNSTREFAMYTIWLVHVVVVVRALIAGANVISREHVGQTWDSLILTGVSTHQILLGKWRAAMRRAAPWMLALGAFRLAMVPMFTMALVTRFAWRMGRYYGYASPSSYSYYANDLQLLPWTLIAAVSGVVLLTLLELMACTALGIAASAVTRRGIAALIGALSVRFAPVVLFAAFTRYELGPSTPVWQVIRFTPLALADGGTSPVAVLSYPLISWTRYSHFDALPGLALSIGLLIGLLIAALLVAWFAIRLMGALARKHRIAAGRGFRYAGHSISTITTERWQS